LDALPALLKSLLLIHSQFSNGSESGDLQEQNDRLLVEQTLHVLQDNFGTLAPRLQASNTLRLSTAEASELVKVRPHMPELA
jgi:hypothetical protein